MILNTQRDCHPERIRQGCAKDLNRSVRHNASANFVLFLCALCVKILLFAGHWSPVTGR